MKKILLVDDSPYILEIYREVLSNLNHSIIGEASNGLDAVELYKQNKPDLVIMDILLPQMDGINSIKKILEFDSDARILAITAIGKPDLDNQCLKLGVKGFIKKPFELKDFTDEVSRILIED